MGERYVENIAYRSCSVHRLVLGGDVAFGKGHKVRRHAATALATMHPLTVLPNGDWRLVFEKLPVEGETVQRQR